MSFFFFFFENGQLLKLINCTTIALVPKVASPITVMDFRPIAYCNVLYKCITKALTARIKTVLSYLISPNQTGFIQGWNIIQNISILQDLIGGYGRKTSPVRCLLKIDIKKRL
ncbi:hypothetical protein RDABS01_031790 [Bienertia sinuspersici]